MPHTLPTDANGRVLAGPGRPKGIPNRPTVQSMQAKLEKMDFDTVAEMVALIKNDDVPYAVRGRLLEVLCRCQYPVIKASQHLSETTSRKFNINIDTSTIQPVGSQSSITVDPVIETVTQTVTQTVSTDDE